jgi:hypothetical protein
MEVAWRSCGGVLQCGLKNRRLQELVKPGYDSRDRRSAGECGALEPTARLRRLIQAVQA